MDLYPAVDPYLNMFLRLLGVDHIFRPEYQYLSDILPVVFVATTDIPLT
jgi:hypothetical protein